MSLIFSSVTFFYSTYLTTFTTFQRNYRLCDIAVSGTSEPVSFSELQENVNSEFTNDELNGYVIHTSISKYNLNYTLNSELDIHTVDILYRFFNFSSEDFLSSYMTTYFSLVEGRYPTKSNEILIFYPYSAYYGINLDDILHFDDYTLTVVGIIEDKGLYRSLSPSSSKLSIYFIIDSYFESSIITTIFASFYHISYWFYFNYEKFEIFDPFRIPSQFEKKAEDLRKLFSDLHVSDLSVLNQNQDFYSQVEFRQIWKESLLYLIKILIPIIIIAVIAFRLGINQFFKMRMDIWEEIQLYSTNSQRKKIISLELFGFINVLSLGVSFGVSVLVFSLVKLMSPALSHLWFSTSYFTLTLLIIESSFIILGVRSFRAKFNLKKERKKKRTIFRETWMNWVFPLLLLVIMAAFIYLYYQFTHFTILEIGTNLPSGIGRDLSIRIATNLIYFVPISIAIIVSYIISLPLSKFLISRITLITKKSSKDGGLLKLFKQMTDSKQIFSAMLILTMGFGAVIYNGFIINQEIHQLECTTQFECGSDFQVFTDEFGINSTFNSALASHSYLYSTVNVCLVERTEYPSDFYSLVPYNYVLLQANLSELANLVNSPSQSERLSLLNTPYENLAENEVFIAETSSIQHSLGHFYNFPVISLSSEESFENETVILTQNGTYVNFPFRNVLSDLFFGHSFYLDDEIFLISPKSDLEVMFPNASKRTLYYISSEISTRYDLESILPQDFEILRDLNFEMNALKILNPIFQLRSFSQSVSFEFLITSIIFTIFLILEFIHSRNHVWLSLDFYGISNKSTIMIFQWFIGSLIVVMTGILLSVLWGVAIYIRFFKNFLFYYESNIEIDPSSSPILEFTHVWQILGTLVVVISISLLVVRSRIRNIQGVFKKSESTK